MYDMSIKEKIGEIKEDGTEVRAIKKNLESIYEVIRIVKAYTREKDISDDVWVDMFGDFFGYAIIALDMMSEKAKEESFPLMEEYVKAEKEKKERKK